MKKLEEIGRTAAELSSLIKNMESEIDRLRNIVYRYYLKHGGSMQGGKVEFEDSSSFILDIVGDSIKCEIVNEDNLGLTSNYQIIKQNIENLNK